MVSAKTHAEDELEPRPTKRQKLQQVQQQEQPAHLSESGEVPQILEQPSQTETVQQLPKRRTIMSSTGFQPEREVEVGILHVVNSANKGFTGVLKHRYTDFMVNEITPGGIVVHLTDDSIPKAKYKDAPIDAVGEVSNAVELEDNSGHHVVATTVSDKPAVEIQVGKTLQVTVQKKPSDASLAVDSKQELHTTSSEVVNENEGSKMENAASANGEEHVKDHVQATAFIIQPEDHEILVAYFGAEFKEKLLEFHKSILSKPTAKPAVFGSLHTPPITDRALRGKMHGDVRRIFESRLETEVQKDGIVQVTAAPPVKLHVDGHNKNRSQKQSRGQSQRQNQSKGKLGWQDLGGEYLHFSLYKENKDTMEVIGFLASRLHTQSRDFAFAGTKDRRAVTVQRVSVRRVHADRVARLNRELRMSRVGNFEYSKHQLELGELQGNEFTITLRDCHFGADNRFDDTSLENDTRLELANEVVGGALEHLRTHGFINYYGLQRFGSFGIGTDEIGKRILSGAFKDAVDGILDYSEETLLAANGAASSDKIARDDIDRAKAIQLFRSGRAHEAVEQMPRKYSGERTVMQYLGRHTTDYLGALQSIHRNLKLMYVHAYQSLVWNIVASERWARYGAKVVEGDLIIVDRKAGRAIIQEDEIDEAGEVVIRPAADDTAVTHDDLFERAHSLSMEEVESGKYTIFDIVLPTPGFDIEYPNNAVGDFYKEFMASDRGGRLDPGNMRRAQKDFSLSGSYRKVIGQAGQSMSFEVKAYSEETEQLVETDLEKLNKSRPNRNGRDDGARRTGHRVTKSTGIGGDELSKEEADAHRTSVENNIASNEPAKKDDGMKEPSETAPLIPEPEIKPTKIAVVLKFTLGTSQYATMALRELMGAAGVKTYKPDFSGGR